MRPKSKGKQHRNDITDAILRIFTRNRDNVLKINQILFQLVGEVNWLMVGYEYGSKPKAVYESGVKYETRQAIHTLRKHQFTILNINRNGYVYTDPTSKKIAEWWDMALTTSLKTKRIPKQEQKQFERLIQRDIEHCEIQSTKKELIKVAIKHGISPTNS